MAKIPRGFISLGTVGAYINVAEVDQEKSYYDKRIHKFAIIDKFGNRYNIDPKLVKGKLKKFK